MKKFKVRKKYSKKNLIIVILLLIILFTSIFLNLIGKKSTNNILYISKELINTITTDTVNSNIKLELMKKYNINDLISIKYQDKIITDINYNLETAYEILISIKKEVINSLKTNMPNIYNYPYEINNNKIIISMPFYNNSNVLISNFGPKIFAQISLIELVDGSVKTKIKTYGINSLLIELYLNITIKSVIVIPNSPLHNNSNSFDILISSKVIQGEIPSIYNGSYESRSDTIVI